MEPLIRYFTSSESKALYLSLIMGFNCESLGFLRCGILQPDPSTLQPQRMELYDSLMGSAQSVYAPLAVHMEKQRSLAQYSPEIKGRKDLFISFFSDRTID